MRRRHHFTRHDGAELVRNFVFGVEDSLVSTVGLVSGIAVAAVPRGTILLTGMTLIFVEAFSMGVGAFLSEEAANDYSARGRHAGAGLWPALIMFATYFIVGLIPLAPYVILPSTEALVVSVALTLASLFGFGVLAGLWIGRHPLRRATEMLALGGGAVLIGMVVGAVFTGT